MPPKKRTSDAGQKNGAKRPKKDVDEFEDSADEEEDDAKSDNADDAKESSENSAYADFVSLSHDFK